MTRDKDVPAVGSWIDHNHAVPIRFGDAVHGGGQVDLSERKLTRACQNSVTRLLAYGAKPWTPLPKKIEPPIESLFGRDARRDPSASCKGAKLVLERLTVYVIRSASA